MSSVSQMIDIVSQLEGPAITVHQERCVLVRNRNAECLRCADVCTSGCIHYDGESLSVALDRCIECGTCATVCPTCALEAHHTNDALLLSDCLTSAQLMGGEACIAYGQRLQGAEGRYDAHKVVRVECLGRIEESLLTQLAARGASGVMLVCADCETCDHATGRATCDAVCETEHALFDAWNTDFTVRFAHKLPASARAKEDVRDVLPDGRSCQVPRRRRIVRCGALPRRLREVPHLYQHLPG